METKRSESNTIPLVLQTLMDKEGRVDLEVLKDLIFHSSPEDLMVSMQTLISEIFFHKSLVEE